MDKLKGVRAIVQIYKKSIAAGAALTLSAVLMTACGSPGSTNSASGVDPNETAAKVNSKTITMQDVDRAVKQQAQGQESKLSPLELAGARLQVLQSLIEEEVMFQKAESEKLVPTDEEVTGDINKRKQESRLSVEEFDKQMNVAGLDEKSFREKIKKGLAIQKLVDKITSRIENPNDGEIEAFYKGNPEMFIKKRGVKLAAIIVDPSDSGQGDVTRNAAEADQKVKEVLGKVAQPASDFASLAREFSEDSSKLQGGDLGYISEADLKQTFGEQIGSAFMNPSFEVGRITNAIPYQGKAYIFKLQERVEKDENLTLESPNVRPQITQLLMDNRKQLLAASYQAVAMNEAKIENYLAKKVVDNPNELSGARPAGAATAANTAANSNVNAAAPANANTASNANATANAAAKPEPKADNTKAANAPANR